MAIEGRAKGRVIGDCGSETAVLGRVSRVEARRCVRLIRSDEGSYFLIY